MVMAPTAALKVLIPPLGAGAGAATGEGVEAASTSAVVEAGAVPGRPKGFLGTMACTPQLPSTTCRLGRELDGGSLKEGLLSLLRWL